MTGAVADSAGACGKGFWLAEVSSRDSASELWGLLGSQFDPPLRVAVQDYQEHIDRLANFARTIVAFSEWQICGAVSFYANDAVSQGGYVSEIAVRDEFRGFGLGKSLMIAAIAASAKAGMEKLRLEVRKENDAAVGLYKSLGFSIEPTETETSYFMCRKLR